MAKRKPKMFNPFSEADFMAMEEEIRRLQGMLPLCDSCDACGVCVDEQKQSINQLIDGYMNILKHFRGAPQSV